MNKNLDSYPWSTRARNVFEDNGITTASQLALLSDAELFRMPNCGRRVLAEIKDFFRESPKDRDFIDGDYT